ncbi:MAG: efflux RND transporter periplasmic adaptor subunit, partial [Myxococcota bacterium]
MTSLSSLARKSLKSGRKLNGVRSIQDVIEVVKSEHNFDISEPDLQRFVSQLESMGFLENGEGGADAPQAETQEFDPSLPTHDLLPDLAADEAAEVAVDRAELERLMRSALLHVKQGYLLHARDYFLAARELDPNNERLSTVIGHLEIVGETPAAAEMEYIWEQASALAPDIADQLGDLMSESGVPGAAPPPETLRVDSEEDIRSRVLWTVALLVVLIVGVGAIYWAWQELEIFSAPQPVRVTELKATRIPVYFPEPAQRVGPSQEKSFGFSESGKVARVEVADGDTVQESQLIAMLELNGRAKKKLAKAQKVVAKAQAGYDRAAKKLEPLEAEAQKIQLQRDQADEKLRELQPKQLLGQGGVSKRDVEK